MGSLAAQLVSSMEQHPGSARDNDTAAYLVVLWQQLGRKWLSTPYAPQSAVVMLPPSMLQLLRHLVMHSPWPSKAATSAALAAGQYVVDPMTLLLCVELATTVCGTVLDLQLHQQAPGMATSSPAFASPTTASSRSSMQEACESFLAAVTEHEVSAYTTTSYTQSASVRPLWSAETGATLAASCGCQHLYTITWSVCLLHKYT